MQTSNTSQSSGVRGRGVSVPAVISGRRVSEPAMPSTVFPTSSGGSHTTAATTSASSTLSQSLSTSNRLRTPLVLTPISQLSRSSRRSSRTDAPFGDRHLNWDPELYNPDGSLRTIHKLPSFEQSYSEALNTRYIRHRGGKEKDKELSVEEIFAKDDLQ